MEEIGMDENISRRKLLLTGGVATIAIVTTSAMAASAGESGVKYTDIIRRAQQSKKIRDFSTDDSVLSPYPVQITNGDEESLEPRYIGNFCKGLPQTPEGFVDEKAYKALLNALESGDPVDFAAIPLGQVPKAGESIVQSIFPANTLAFHAQPATRFYRSAMDIAQIATVQSTLSENEAPAEKPRFFRMHSEQVASLDGKSLLINPQAALGYDLEGGDSHSFRIPPPPSYGSEEIVAEIAENYWMALLRDIPFYEFANPGNKDVMEAIDDLNTLGSSLKVPRENSKITGKTLFRGTAPGELVGPYVSQFLLRTVPFGAYEVPQRVRFGYEKKQYGANTAKLDQVFLINQAEWYGSQLGLILPAVAAISTDEKINYRPRELCNFVHIDELFQGYLNAELIMSTPPERGGLGVQVAKGNPYRGSDTQTGFGTLGEPNFASLVAEVATRALKAVWFQKWGVHRRLRPEAFAGHLHSQTANSNLHYPFHSSWKGSLQTVFAKVKKFNEDHGGEGYFLPMAFRDGAPSHPAYGAGHATVAGACITLLKAFYDDTPFSQLVSKDREPGADIFDTDGKGDELMPLANPKGFNSHYQYAVLKDEMTVHGELNKLASNVSLARNFAGVHWRSDHAASIVLGEKVALKFLHEVIQTYNEDVYFAFNGFDGRPITVSKA